MQKIKQSINLYLPRFQPAQLSAEVKQLFIALILAVLASILSIALSAVYASYYKEERAISEKSKIQLSAELEKVIAQVPDKTPDKNLIERLTKKEHLLIRKQKVIEYLYRDTINEGESFTLLVSELSKQQIEDVWLSKIEVLNKGKDIQLYGYAKYPDTVSSYLEMLSNQPSYQGRGFKRIEINKLERWSEFYISTLSKIENEELNVETAEVRLLQ